MLVMSQDHKRVFDMTGNFLMVTYDKTYDSEETYLGLFAHISIYNVEHYRNKDSLHFVLAEYESVDTARHVMEGFYECVRNKRDIFMMPTKEDIKKTRNIGQ